MDNNTLFTLVCILIAVIALLVCISLFFIYRLEEKNAHQRHVIDVLLSTINRLKVQKLITILILALTATLTASAQQQMFGDIRWRHSEGVVYSTVSPSSGNSLNATDFQYGLSARYTLPRLNTTLSADGNMYSRRGYGSSELNTDDFVLNASVSQPFFKGKLIARIEAFDLLHQLSSTQYAVNAQGRTETWYRSLPHYVMAHLVYHWNKNPKKK